MVTIALASANPKREWSVKTVPRPRRLATNKASCAKGENAEWPCTIWIRSFAKIRLKIGSDPTSVGKMAWL